MADARVICSIERLFDWEPANEAVIGVTLSAAWGNPSNPPPANFLLPWKWLPWEKGPENLGFYWACCVPGEANVSPKFSAAPVFPRPLVRNNKSISSIRSNGDYLDFAKNSIQPRYDQISTKLANLGYPKDGQNTITVTAAASDGPGDASGYGSGAFWPSILADLSTRPAPIPHALLLSFIFQVGKIADLLPKRADGTTPDPANCYLLFAPVLTAKATGKTSDTNPVHDPAVTPLSQGNDASSLFWNYADNNYQSNSQMVALGGPPKRTSFFDMATRLVKAAGDKTWHFNEDWQSSFESRLGERLDLSAGLVSILEKETFDDSAARNVIDAAIAALRDVAGIGIDPATSSVSFLQTSNVDQATITKIYNALNISDFADVVKWKNFLKMTVFGKPETILSDAYLTNLDLWNSGPIKAADAVRQFNRVRQKLFAPDALWALLQLQISALVPSTTVTQPGNLSALPAILKAENLGRYYKELRKALGAPAGGYSADAIRQALTGQLQALAIARFSDPHFLPTVSAAVAAAAATALNKPTSVADWTAAAKYAIPEAASAPSTDPGQGASALASQGITVQINELGDTANANVTGNEAKDVRKLQGAALLLGYDITAPGGGVSTSGYKCVNYADVCYRSTSGGTTQCKILEHAALAPLRFTWHNDVALATVCYNNEPLPAAGPLSRAAKLVSPGGGDSVVAVGTDLLWYSYPTTEKPDPLHPDLKITLTALTFGRDYRPQPFLISNSGAVPNSLATGYLDLKTGNDLDQVAGIGDTWTSINYRRQKLPGALRLSNPNADNAGTGKHLKLPAIPDGVFPRVRPEDDQPVVILVPPDPSRFTNLPTNFAVNVRPPSTDLLTWDRFVNGFGNGLAASRDGVFNGFLAEIARHVDQKSDITIDDPATVYSGYDCRLRYELLDEDQKPIAADFISFPTPLGPGIAAVQADALHFSFVAAKDDSNLKTKPPSIKVESPKVTVTVYEGRFATLRLHACVHKNYASRFEKSLLSGETPTGDYYCLKSTNVVVEVATDALPSEPDLFDGNRFQVGAFNKLNGTAAISLNLAGATNGQYVYSAEVLRQVWKWQGRPVEPLPATGDLTSEWLVREFGTRADTDLLRVPMLPPPTDSRTYVFTEQRGSLLSDADRARGNLQQAVSGVAVPAESRLLGTYIRYGVQVESCYKPLLLQNGYVRAKGVDSSLWRNLYIPSRKLTQIKPPDVKLVLPLTRNATDPKAGPGLLVMLRGPWFQECGLGERLEAQLTLTESPDEDPSKTTTKTFYYQYGPDPILSNPDATKLKSVHADQAESGWGTSVAEKKAKARDQRETIHGPVGHTFDTVSSGQLFINTSFVLNYPVVENQDWTPWSFCQLQVRRVVDVIGSVSPASSSIWSPPVWIQLLPDFDLYSSNAAFADLELRYQAGPGNFRLVNRVSGQAVTLTPGNGDPIYANYLAVTHFVSDVTGIPVQEAYDGLYRQSGTDWIPIGASPGASADVLPYYRARVLTVQGKKPSVTQEKVFWDNIFLIEKDPGNPDGILVGDIDRLRIIAVSRPIDVPNAPYRGC
jgi:hypothetical protein